MIRVAHVTDSTLFHRYGGKEVRANEIFKALPRERFLVHTFTMAPANERKFSNQSFTAISKFDELYTGSKRRLLATIWFSLNCLKLLFAKFDLIDTDQIPLVHLIPLWLVSVVRRKPLFVTWHEYWPKNQWVAHMGSLGYVGIWLQKLTLNIGDSIICVSQQTFEAILESGVAASRVSLIQAGLDHISTRKKTQEKSKENLNLLYIGRLIEHKKIDLVIEAVSLACSAGASINLDIVGAGPNQLALEDLAVAVVNKHRGRLTIRFHGPMEPGGDLDMLLQLTDLFISASEREGFGLAVAEAMAHGIPVIVSNHPENKAKTLVMGVLGCGTFAAGSSRDLSVQILGKLHQQVASEAVRDSFFEHHSDLTWAVSGSLLAATYEKCLNE